MLLGHCTQHKSTVIEKKKRRWFSVVVLNVGSEVNTMIEMETVPFPVFRAMVKSSSWHNQSLIDRVVSRVKKPGLFL